MNRVHLLTAAVTGFWLWVFNLGTSSDILVLAQSITPAADGTGTIVTPDGNRIDISGGSLSADGKNLFQSFQQFGLNPEEVANFLANPDLNNILSRVVGGDASVINGLIQVTGGNPNLYIMNPAGIIFGPSSQLNVPGDFFATTANAIGFDNGNWFNAIGTNDYNNLVGNPNQFAFDGTEAGSIVNAGDLAVSEGKNLTLLAGNVVNTGKLTAPGGSITIAAVPGSNLVKISRPGGLLSLEVEPPRTPDGELLPVQPGDLAELLTGSGEEVETGVEVNESGDVQLADTGVTLPKETGVAIVSGEINVSNVGTPSPSSSTGGEINVIGNKVGLIAANLDASGSHGGGTIRIGGGEKGLEPIPNADVTFISEDSRINADALDEGGGGRTIVWSDQTTRTYGHISARGGENGGNGGFVETSSAGFLDVPFAPDITAPAGDGGTWLIDPYNITISAAANTIGGTAPNFTAAADNSVLNINTLLAGLTGGNVTVDTGGGGTQAGNITLATNLDFNTKGIKTLTLIAAKDIIIDGQIFDSDMPPTPGDGLSLVFNAGGAVELNQSISTGGGNLRITANGAITQNSGTLTIGGVATLAAGANSINLGNANNFNQVFIPSASNVTLNDVDNIALGNSNISGNLNVTTTQGFIGNVNQNDALVVQGVATLNSGSNVINLPGSDNNFNQVFIPSASNVTLNDVDNIALGNSNISGNLNVTTTQGFIGNVNQNDALVVQGVATLNSGSNVINLPGSGNDFNTVAVTSARNVTLNDSNAINLGASTITGDLDVTAANVNINDTVSAANATLKPTSPTSTIGIGDGATGAFNLNATLSNLQSSGTVTIGSSTVTGNVNINDVDLSGKNFHLTIQGGNPTFTGNLDLPNNLNVTATTGNISQNSGTVAVTGGTTLNATGNDITLNNANNFSTVAVTSARNVTLNDSNAIVLGASTITGTLGVTAGGNITDSGNLNVTDGTTLNATGNDITLNNANNFNTVAVTSARNVTLNDSNAINLGASTITGDLDVTAANVNINDTVSAANATLKPTSPTSTIGIGDGATGAFNLNATLSNLQSSGTVTIGSSTVTGNVNINDVDLSGKNFHLTIQGGNPTFTGNLDLPNNLNVTATTGNITQNGGTVTVNGQTTLATGNSNDITFVNTTNNFNTVAVTSGRNVTLNDNNGIDLGTATITGTLGVTAGGNITGSGNLNVTGGTTLNATGNDITLNNANNFSTVVANGANVTLNDTDEINLGASNITGTLDVTAGGNITDSGNLNVTGGTILNAVGHDITLDNANDFSTVAANGANVTLNDTDEINLGATDIDGNLEVTATDINVTDAVNTGGNITLKPSTNTSTIALNDATGDFTLNTTELNRLNPANTVTIGGTSGTGGISIGSQGAINLSSTSYNLTLNGGATTFNNGITLNNDKTLRLNTGAITSGTSNPDITISGTNGKLVLNTTADVGNIINPLSTQVSQLEVTTASGSVFVNNTSGNLELGRSEINGELNLTNNSGDITNNGAVTVTDTTTVSGGNNDITLDNNNNNFTTVTVTSGNNVTLNDSDTIQLGNSQINADLNITADGTIIGSGNLNVNGIAKFDANGNNITLNNANNFNTVEISRGGNVEINDINDIKLGDSNVSGDLNVQANGVITDSGNLTVANNTTFDASGNNILLNKNHDFNRVEIISGNNVILNDTNAIDLGASTINGNFNVTANSNITDSGNLTIANGTTQLNANGNDITLDNDNDFNTVEVSSANKVTLNDINSIDLGTSTIAGELEVTANDTLSTSATVDVGGDTTLTATEIDFLGGINTVTGNGRIQLQPRTSSQGIAIAGAEGTDDLDISQRDIDALDGFNPTNPIIIGQDNGSNPVQIVGDVIFDDAVKIQSPEGSIDVDGNITGTGNASIELNSSNIKINADIITDGEDITIGNNPNSNEDNIEISADIVEINTGGDQAGNIIFNGDVNGKNDSTQTLQVSPGTGEVFFNGQVGNIHSLKSLIIGDDLTGNADLVGSSTTVFNSLFVNAEQTKVAGQFKTNGGPIQFTGHVILLTDVTFDTTFNTDNTDTAGNIIFGGTVSSAISDENFPDDSDTPPFNLTLIAGKGNIEFRGDVGAQNFGSEFSIPETQNLGSLTIESAREVKAVVDDDASLPLTITTLAPETLPEDAPKGISILASSIDFSNANLEAEIVNLEATENISTASVTATEEDITLNSEVGSIDTSQGTLTATQGDVKLNASQGNITTADIEVTEGEVNLTATQGSVTTANVEAPTVNFRANNDINTASVTATEKDITLDSEVGSIDTSQGTLTATQGDVKLNASQGDITTADIEVTEGEVNLTATQGSVTTANVEAPMVNIQANNNINTASVTATAENITLNSEVGSIDTSQGTLTATQGDVKLDASQGNITTADIEVTEGEVNLTATQGSVTTANVEAPTVNLQANNDINTASVTATEEDITLNSQGSINTSQGKLTATQGDVNLTANLGNITTGEIEGESVNLQANNGIATANISSTDGRITLTSQSGAIQSGNLTAKGEIEEGETEENAVTVTTSDNITTGNIDTSSETGKGNAIALTSQTGDITTQNLNSSGPLGGGSIDASTLGQITLGEVNSSSTGGFAGLITLNNGQPEFLRDAPGIDLTFINAQGLPRNPAAISLSPTETEGTEITINITTDGYLRATGTFVSQTGLQASLATGGDPIVIRHGGGTAFDPFEVGNATQNGTVGAITNGNGFTGTILPIQSFTRPVRQENIEIISRIPDQKNLPVTSLYPNLSLTSKVADADLEISTLDSVLTDAFSGYLGPKPSVNNPADAPKILAQIEKQTGVKPAFMYATFVGGRLELRMVSSEEKKIVSLPDVTQETIVQTATKLRREITNPIKRRTTSYLEPAQQLYEWLIAPLEAELEAQGIQNLVFIMDSGLRSLPVAALHDGQKFLVEKYSVGLMPSLSITDTSYNNIQNAPVLAMGVAESSSLAKELNLSPLPAVPLELQTIESIRDGETFLNEKVTLETLKTQSQDATIVHLATHGEFKSGPLKNSYILLWNDLLRLNQLRELGWNERRTPIELLILSACRTAVGDEKAELGFAGLAVQAGAKSALSSLWYVSDEGTSGLMTEFYRKLQTAPIKAEALRQAQLAMLNGDVRLEGGQLRGSGQPVPLPPALESQGDKSLSHPYYWAAFTMIGSPW